MRLLLLSDTESPAYWDYFVRSKLDDIDLILSCGDLKAEYLSFLVTMGHAPLLYVHGNHDGGYEHKPPEGCDCIEDKLVTINGLRILGLGGSRKYSGGPHQYTDRQMQRRIWKQSFALWRSKGVDLVLTHAPVRDYGDQEDMAHRGFDCFQGLIDRYHPRYLVHGHVHMNYGHDVQRTLRCGDTTLINAYGHYILDIEP